MSTSSNKTVVVTGAGSGIGRGTALRFLAEGWQVALVGRRSEPLAETVAFGGTSASARAAIFPCDIGDANAVDAMAAAVLARFGRVDALVNAAGTNIPRRSWGELSREDYHAVLATNLNGAVYCVQAFLPGFRAQGGGTVVNINSEAGLQASAKSGVAYVASKFALTGLTQSLNAEERAHGIRACSIFPGDVDTPLLDRRPQPPSREARAAMLQPDDVAACVWLAVTLPPRALVEQLVIRPR
jgi:NAD(P)-dependent dehydrogenase (short-subunit alcohol dehydrogenase family)